jgi:murein DD-endopeptidase MepM/ murein hydrolase activator NlpD
MKSFVAFIVLLAVMAGTVTAGAQSQSDIDEIDRKIDVLKDQASGIASERSAQLVELEAAQGRLRVARAAVAEAQAKVDSVTAEIADNEAQLDELNIRLDRLAIEVANTRLEIREARLTFQDRAAELYMQRASSIGSSVVVNVDDMASMSVAMRYSDDVFDSSERLLNILEILERTEQNQQLAIEENQRTVEVLLAGLEIKRAALEDDKIALAAAAAIVDQEVHEAARILASIEAEIAEIEGEIAAFEAEQSKLEADLNRLTSAGGTNPGRLSWPLNGSVSSGFGYRIHPISGARKLHTGLDISGGSGAPIAAAGSGTVIWANWYGGYGMTVIIDHGGGLTTLYAHQSSLNVSTGSSVSAGSTIGYVGSTGYSTGPHLHFETRERGTPVNPMNYLNG